MPTPPLKRFRIQLKDTLVFLLIFMVLGFTALGYLFFEFQEEVQEEQYQLKRQLTKQQETISNVHNVLEVLVEGNEVLTRELAITREQQEVVATVTDDRISELQQDIATGGSDEIDIATIVSSWSARIARLSCTFFNSRGDELQNDASAVATFINGVPYFATNRHVVDKFGLTLSSCSVENSDGTVAISIPVRDMGISPDRDLAILRVRSAADFSHFASSPVSSCDVSEVSIGDTVVILGYPSVGSETSITATEGIISGFDDGYFVTSAKIEQGNSGGAAVNATRDCFLGTPTLAKVGQVESLARILPF